MKIKVLSKKHIVTDAKGKESVFYTYFTPVMIHVIDSITGADMGEQKKKINVHFTKVATKKLPEEKVFAIIGAKDGSNIQLPYVYKVTKNEKTGELEYPECWVRDFDTYEPIPYVAKESTCKPIIDEEETEPVEIIEENE